MAEIGRKVNSDDTLFLHGHKLILDLCFISTGWMFWYFCYWHKLRSIKTKLTAKSKPETWVCLFITGLEARLFLQNTNNGTDKLLREEGE